MDLSETLLKKTVKDANLFASKMMIVLVIISFVCTLFYGSNFSADNTVASIRSTLLSLAIVSQIIVLLVAVLVLYYKGEGRGFPHIIAFCLILMAVACSFSLRTVIWPLFIFCVVYSIRYSNYRYTCFLGIICTILIVAQTFLLIPFGFATGSINMNYVALSEDTVLSVKGELNGLYDAVTQQGNINMKLLYLQAFFDLIGPLVAYGFISIVFSFIARYNERKIKNQINDLESINEFQIITQEAGIELWHIQLPNDNDPQLHVSERLLEFLMIETLDDFTERDVYKYWFSHIKGSSVSSVLNFFEELQTKGKSEITYVWCHPQRGEIFVRWGGYSEKNGNNGYIFRGYHLDVNDIVTSEIKQKQMLRDALEEAEKQRQMFEDALEKYKKADTDRRTDFLTGLRNRQDMFELLQEALNGVVKNITSMFMMDIDNFKMLNDTYGHGTGDECLKKIGAALLKYGKKNNMYFFRYGGEEMLGISFKTKKTPATIAEELVELVRDLKIKRTDVKTGCVTISVGYTTDNRRYEKMIDKADTAMYTAKKLGKNRAICFEEL